jgi:tetratricopeptide (TPR) repeat protein
MKNIIIAVILTPVIALSLVIAGCSPNYDSVIADSTKALEKNPDDAEAYRERASAWEEKGDYDQAIADYSKAIELDQDDVTLYYLRGHLYGEKGRYDRAIADCDKAIEIGPDDAKA